MAQDRKHLPADQELSVDPALERPEADLVEQQQPLDETALTDDDPDVDDGAAVPDLAAGDEEADEADLLEQATPVAGTDDDYPYGPDLPLP